MSDAGSDGRIETTRSAESPPAAAVPPGRSRQLLRVQALFLLVYGAYGTTSVFRIIYYRRVELTGAEIGALIALEPLVMLISGPLWSLVADRTGLRGRLLTLVTALCPIPLLAMIWMRSFGALAALTAAHALFLGPIQPLTDSSALAALGAQRQTYGRVRALGSFSYALVLWITGILVAGRDLRWTFPAFALFMGAASLVSTRVPAEGGTFASNIPAGLRHLVRDRAWIVFMVALFISMMLQSVTFSYSSLYLDGLGASEDVVGFAGALGSFTQMLLLILLIPILLRRWGSERLMLLALGVYALRLAIWGAFPQVWVVVTSMAVMGLTFGASLVAAVEFADRHAPPGLAVTSQALATGLVSGMGRALGGALAGSLYDGAGPRVTFGLFAGLALVTLLVFARLWRGQRAPASRS